MEKILPASFLITQKVTQKDTTNDPTTVAPVINSGNHKTKNKQHQHPSTYLFVNGLPVGSTSALTVIKAGAYEATNCS